MKKTVDIMDYCNKLFAADLFAGVVLEEDYDTGCNYTWSAAGDDWADKFRAELNGYISAGCCAERAADYRKAPIVGRFIIPSHQKLRYWATSRNIRRAKQ